MQKKLIIGVVLLLFLFASVFQVSACSSCVDVVSFGAAGDGLSDDTYYIQSAIDYLANRGGGVLHFPTAKVFRMAGAIALCNNLTIEGNFSTLYFDPPEYLEKCIVCSGTTPSIKTLTADAHVGDRYVDVNNTTGISAGTRIYLNQTIWNGNYPKDFLTVASVTTTRITFDTPILAEYLVANSANVYKVVPKHDISIENLNLDFSPESDSKFGLYLSYIENVSIRGMKVSNHRTITDPNYQATIYTLVGRNVSIKNCYLEKPQAGNGNGICLGIITSGFISDVSTQGYSFPIGAYGCIAPKIDNCVVRGQGGVRGIKVAYCVSPSVTDNTVSYCDTGLKYEGSGWGIVKGNTFNFCGVSSQSVGINLGSLFVDDSFMCNNIITGNIVRNQTGLGVYVIDGNENCIISDNIIENSSYGGIWCYIPATIHHNTIINWGTTGAHHGIMATPGSVITDNRLIDSVGVSYGLRIYPDPVEGDTTIITGNQCPNNTAYNVGNVAIFSGNIFKQ